MKVTKYEIKALENVLGCMRHYVLIGHVKMNIQKQNGMQLDEQFAEWKYYITKWKIVF